MWFDEEAEIASILSSNDWYYTQTGNKPHTLLNCRWMSSFSAAYLSPEDSIREGRSDHEPRSNCSLSMEEL